MGASLSLVLLLNLGPLSGIGGLSADVSAKTQAGAEVDAGAPATPQRLRARQLVTGGARLDEPLPLVVVLHGRGGRADGFMRRFFGLGVPARVVALEGPRPLGRDGGFSWLSQRAKDAPAEQVVRELGEAADAVSAEIDRLMAEYPTQGRPILVGYSQGGMVALTVAARRPDRFAEVIAASSYLPPELGPGASGHTGPDGAQGPRVHLVHGRADGVVSHARARATAQELRDAAWEVELTTVQRGHQLQAQRWQRVLAQLRAALRAHA